MDLILDGIMVNDLETELDLETDSSITHQLLNDLPRITMNFSSHFLLQDSSIPYMGHQMTDILRKPTS